MKIKDFTKEELIRFESTNPKVIYNNKINTYEIEYDAVYKVD